MRSVRLNEGDMLPYDPFALDETSGSRPTMFEIQFIQKEVLYRYGFEYNRTEIISEWLYEKRFGEKANSIMGWFRDCNVLSGIETGGYEAFSLRMFLDHLNGADEAQEFFRTLQLGFTRFTVKKTDIPQQLTTHNVYDEKGLVVGERNFHKNQMESEGTKKVIEMSGPIFDTLNEGKTLIVDELDAKLHPLLTRNIVLLFMDPERNPKGAQLIFATHDTNLLDLEILRRDQIWFAEKDKVESTDIYSLVEFKDEDGKKVRNDRDIKKDYIRGRYGAIPFIGK